MYKYFGVYRAVAVNPADTSDLKRIRVTVPSLSTGDVWAFPLLRSPTAAMPDVRAGDGVWVMFEGGDLNYPVWVGFYSAAEREPTTSTPTAAAEAQNDSFVTLTSLNNVTYNITVDDDGSLITTET